DLASIRFNDLARLLLQVMAESVVGGDEEPTLASGRDGGLRGGTGYAIVIEAPVQRVRIARVTSQLRRARRGYDSHLVLLCCQAGNAERNRRVGEIDDDLDTFLIEPPAGSG